ncbi:type I secretion target repeat protein [Rhodobacteraceae bacterium KLH11]|nr:type I secretion target repeat protein [Rhodobacteraceae bacterium KLH11]
MARISELHYSNAYAAQSGVAEFLEVSLRGDENPADFTVSFYEANGQVGIEIPLTDVPAAQVSIDPNNNEQVFVISADDFPILLTDPNGGGANNFEAYALTNTSTGEVIDFYDIGGGTQNIVAQNGLAAGETSVNLPVLVTPGQTTTSLQFNQPDPDTLVYAGVTPGDSGAPCFVAGTLVDTPDGPRRVETLAPGDHVLTVDDGACPVRWVGSREIGGQGRFAPVQIAAGVLGAQCDIGVSPQHRVLVTGWQAQLWFGEDEILVPAKALINDTTIRQVPCKSVQYVHLFFDRHQLVRTSGLISESFFPGQEGLLSLDPASIEELFSLFPELRDRPGEYGQTIRPVRYGAQASVLMTT